MFHVFTKTHTTKLHLSKLATWKREDPASEIPSDPPWTYFSFCFICTRRARTDSCQQDRAGSNRYIW